MCETALSRQFGTAALLRFALPNIAMMVFLSLYTIVDGIFISRYVGTLALSAVNMSYPLNSLEMALGIMLGTGGSAIIARELGEGKERRARGDFTAVVAVSLVLGILCMAAGLVFLDPLLRLLGTSDAQFQLCRTYTQVLLCFSPALFLQTVFQILFVTAGRPGLGLGVTVAGGVANVVLDLLFMGPLRLGVAGAAVATGIGYCISAVAGTVYFFKNRTGALWFTPFRLRWRMLLQTCWNGSSEMVSNVANAVTTFLFNVLFLAYWGEDGVASITIVMYFQFVFSAMYLGFSMGVAPVVSFKYGAQDREQLQKIFRSCGIFILLRGHVPAQPDRHRSVSFRVHRPREPGLCHYHGGLSHLCGGVLVHGGKYLRLLPVYGALRRGGLRCHLLCQDVSLSGEHAADPAAVAGSLGDLAGGPGGRGAGTDGICCVYPVGKAEIRLRPLQRRLSRQRKAKTRPR